MTLDVAQLADGGGLAPGSLEGTSVDITLFGDPGSGAAESLMHRFPIRDGKVEFTVHQLNYHEIRVALNDYFASPSVTNYPDYPDPRLDLSRAPAGRFPITLLPKAKARGRVVDSQGKPVAGAGVYGSIARPDRPSPLVIAPSDAANTKKPWGNYHENWISGGNAETDEDGYFTLELARGVVKFEVIKEGYFSSPVETELQWSGNPADALPTKAIYTVPVVRGHVFNHDGQAQPGMLVRLTHYGVGDADSMTMTDSNGAFELTMQRLPYDPDQGDVLSKLHVVAFDPRGRNGALRPV